MPAGNKNLAGGTTFGCGTVPICCAKSSNAGRVCSKLDRTRACNSSAKASRNG